MFLTLQGKGNHDISFLHKTWRLVDLRALNVCVLAAFRFTHFHAASDSLTLSILPCQEHIDGKRRPS